MSNNMITIFGRGARHLETADAGKITVVDFANGEIRVGLKESLRAKDVTVVQSFRVSPMSDQQLTVNDLWVETLLICDAVRRAGAERLTLVCPFLPYTRQDRQHTSGVPLSARVLADTLAAVNIDRLVTFDLHADQIQGFLGNDIVFDHLSLLPYMSSFFNHILVNEHPDDVCMCSTDAGSAVRTRKMGEYLGVQNLAMISKVRDKPNSVAGGQLVGDVEGKFCILVDDMIDTGGSLVKAYELLKESGARKIAVVAVHGILSGEAVDRLSVFDHVVVSNTLPVVSTHENQISRFCISRFMTELLNSVQQRTPVGYLMDVETWETGVTAGHLRHLDKMVI